MWWYPSIIGDRFINANLTVFDANTLSEGFPSVTYSFDNQVLHDNDGKLKQ